MRLINYKELESKIKEYRKTGQRKSIGCGEHVILQVYGTAKPIFFARIVDKDRKEKKIRLGTYPDLKLGEARQQARAVIADLQQAAVAAELEAANQCPPFGAFIDQWLETKKDGEANKRFMTLRGLRRHISALDGKRLNEIRPADLCEVLDNQETTAGVRFRAVQCFNQAMKYAINRGLLEHNPCAALTNAAEGIYKKPKVKGFESVPPAELKSKFFDRLIFAPVQAKLILTYIAMSCARLEEAVNLRWSWIDQEKRLITIPAEFMKMARPHTVPLTPQLEAVLQAYTHYFPKQGDLVFYAANDPTKTVRYAAIQTPVRSACKGIATIHGLRKTARTYFAENHADFEVAERCLAHEEKSGVVRAYQKYDYLEERRALLEQWDAFILGQLPPEFVAVITGEAV